MESLFVFARPEVIRIHAMLNVAPHGIVHPLVPAVDVFSERRLQRTLGPLRRRCRGIPQLAHRNTRKRQ
jgi:hypothetical protein